LTALIFQKNVKKRKFFLRKSRVFFGEIFLAKGFKVKKVRYLYCGWIKTLKNMV
jgi:hypothetical protein